MPAAARAVTRATVAGALSLALGMSILPAGSGSGSAARGPAVTSGTGRHAVGVVGAGTLHAALTADHRAALDFPRTAMAAHGIPARGSLVWEPVARNGWHLRGLTVLSAGRVRPPAGYLMAPLEVLVPTSPFGLRTSPISGLAGDFHLGQDYAAACGTAVYAADSGVVRAAGWHPWGGGNRVEVDHGNGLVTTYNHLESSTVHAGDVVQAGQAIARVGSTGWSTGCHLHFETILNGRHVSPLSWILLPLSALADLPPARPGGPVWDSHPGPGTAGYAPWVVPPLPGSATTALDTPAAPAPSAAPPPPAAAPAPAALPSAPPPAEPSSPPAPPAEPAPPPAATEPAPTEPAPTDPAPIDPATADPVTPTGPGTAEPDPTQPSEPTPAESPPTEPTPGEPTPGEPGPGEPTPGEPGPAEPAPKPAAAGKGVPPSYTPGEAPARVSCGQGIPSRNQYAGLPVTNHQYGQLREDAACGIPVPDPPDAQ